MQYNKDAIERPQMVERHQLFEHVSLICVRPASCTQRCWRINDVH
jgi:hypothetical protein